MMGLTGGALFLTAALAAANALFGIAYPIPVAQAKESLKAAVSSSQIAIDHAARQSLQTSEPAATSVAPDQTRRSDTVGDESKVSATAQPQSAKNSQPENLVVPSPDLRLLHNENLATPIVVASSAAPAPTPNDQPAASPAPGSVQPSLNNPAASNEPATVYHCHNTSVFGRVISPKAIQMQGFTCFLDANYDGSPASSGGLHDIPFGSCPLASTTSAHKSECKWDVALNVRLADSADAAKMRPGMLVRLGGDFRATRQRQTDYLTVENARVLFVDLFRSGAPSNLTGPNLTAPNVVPPFYNGGEGGWCGTCGSNSGGNFP
jgi:hypothetical protein